MNVHTPEFKIPHAGRHVWDWFASINSVVSRYSEGVFNRIPPSEYKAWADITGTIVYPYEYVILMEMDEAFCTETNKEIASDRLKKEEERKRQSDKQRGKIRR